jgi:hypothetical protein
MRWAGEEGVRGRALVAVSDRSRARNFKALGGNWCHTAPLTNQAEGSSCDRGLPARCLRKNVCSARAPLPTCGRSRHVLPRNECTKLKAYKSNLQYVTANVCLNLGEYKIMESIENDIVTPDDAINRSYYFARSSKDFVIFLRESLISLQYSIFELVSK